MTEAGTPFREDPLSYGNTLVIRAALFVAIFVFHGGFEFGYQFPNLGYTCVAGFFFLSGYGLEYSVRNKPAYLSGFLQKRVFGIMIQYWVIQAVAAAALLVLYMDAYVAYDRVTMALFRHPIWFVTELIVFYILFFIASMARDGRRKLLIILAGAVVMMLLMTDYFGTNLYLKSGMGFVLGVAWGMHREAIHGFLARHYLPVMALSVVVLLLTYRFFNDLGDLFACGVTCVFSMVALYMACMADPRQGTARLCIPLLIIIGALGCWLRAGAGLESEGSAMMVLAGIVPVLLASSAAKKILGAVGAMSFELYVLQFIPLEGLYPDLISSAPVAFTVSLVVTLALSYAAWRLARYVLGRYNAGLERFTAAAPSSSP